jgi:hypothetical protein
MDKAEEGLNSTERSKLASLVQLLNGHTRQERGAGGSIQDQARDELWNPDARRRPPYGSLAKPDAP